MIEKRAAEIDSTGPHYLGWRSELLAEAALARLPDVEVHPVQQDSGYDFIVATKRGSCFFVVVHAFSSLRNRWRVVENMPEWKWTVDSELIRLARQSPTPWVLLVFDADSDHGRFARLDLLPEPSPNVRSVSITLKASQSIDEKNLSQLVAELDDSAHNHRSA